MKFSTNLQVWSWLFTALYEAFDSNDVFFCVQLQLELRARAKFGLRKFPGFNSWGEKIINEYLRLFNLVQININFGTTRNFNMVPYRYFYRSTIQQITSHAFNKFLQEKNQLTSLQPTHPKTILLKFNFDKMQSRSF